MASSDVEVETKRDKSGETHPGPTPDPSMPRLFISYSRKDIVSARQLTEAFSTLGIAFWIDWEGIPLTVDWWKEIEKGIEEADLFLFLISPDSAQSRVCQQEIEHAMKNGKRLIPVVVRDIAADTAPSGLGHLNWSFLRANDDFDQAFGRLITAIKTDYEWVQTHRQLQVKALEWERSSHENSLLLRGKELQEAELQLAGNSRKEPQPTDLQRDYVLRSRQASDRQRVRTASITTLAMIVLAVLAVVAFVQSGIAREEQAAAETARADAVREADARGTAQAIAEANQKLAEERATLARAGELAAQSVSLRESQFDLSLLLAIEAFRTADTQQTRASLFESALAKPELSRYLREDQKNSVEDLAFRPDGKILASASGRTVSFWDAATGLPTGQPFTVPTTRISALAFSPDGTKLATGDGDNTIRLWNVATRQPIDPPFRAHTDIVQSVGFSPDGERLVSRDGRGIVLLWDVSTGESIGNPIQASDEGRQTVAFSPDGSTLAFTTSEHVIQLWEIATGQLSGEPFRGHFQAITSVAFSPDGTLLASSSADHYVFLWDIKTRKLLGWHGAHVGSVTHVAFSPDGKTLVSRGADDSVLFWDVKTRQLTGQSLTGQFNVSSLAISPDGKTIATGSLGRTISGRTVASGSLEGTIILWDISSPLPHVGQRFLRNQDWVRGEAFSPDGKLFATGGCESLDSQGRCVQASVTLWDLATRTPVGKPLKGPTNAIVDVAFSPDGKMLAAGSWDDTIIFWDVATGQPVGEPFIANLGGVSRVAFSPDGKVLAFTRAITGSLPAKLILLDIATRQPIGQPLDGGSFAFSPDGKILAADTNVDIGLWETATAQLIGYPFEEPTDALFTLAFSPDGKMIASSHAYGSIILREVATGRSIGNPIQVKTGDVKGLAFSPDGKWLASASGTTNLWDLETQVPVPHTLPGHSALVKRVTFSPDGQILASIDEDSNIILWALDVQSWIETNCQRVGRNLTLVEWAQYFPNEEYRKTCEEFPKDPGYYQGIVEQALSGSDVPRQIHRALEQLRNEMKTDSAIQDPAVISVDIVEEAIVKKIAATNTEGKLSWIRQAQEGQIPLDPFLNDPTLLNSFCWFGSLKGYAPQVLTYCDRAVDLAPFNAAIRDSRGLARALTGDYAGAIEDFQFCVENDDSEEFVRQRQEWILELQAGRNPITPEVLEGL
jgi:WD40 repeat protein